MRADLHVQSSPAIGNTVLKLAFLGAILLSCVYGVLKLFASAIAVFQ